MPKTTIHPIQPQPQKVGDTTASTASIQSNGKPPMKPISPQKRPLPYKASILPMDSDHVYEVWRLWRELVEELRQPYPLVDEEEEKTVLKILYDILNYPDQNCVLMAKVGKEIVGFIAGKLVGRVYGKPHKIASALYFYVRPEYRNRLDIGPKLYTEAEKWAKDKGAEVIELSTIPTKSYIEKWMKKGFKPFVVWFYKLLQEE